MTIGVDGCKSGWVAAIFQQDRIDLEVFSALDALWLQYRSVCSLLLIDMPIGFSPGGPDGRECDRLARRMLSPRRHSSIFTPPCRNALYTPKEEASDINFRYTGKKLSRQTINIMPKMQEVDRWMQHLSAEDQRRIRESHPEVAFTAMNAGIPLFHNKKKKEGRSERLGILKKYEPKINSVLKKAQSYIPRKVALTDDLIDALVLGLTAKIVVEDSAKALSLPESPPLDERGLSMEIFYPDF